MAGDSDAASDAFGRSLAEFERLGDRVGVARLLHRLASAACYRGDPDQARRLLAQVEELLPELDAPGLDAEVAGTWGTVEELNGDLARALDLYLESARRAGAVGCVWWEAVMTCNAAEVADTLGRPEDALPLGIRSLALLHRVGDRQNTVWALAGLAALRHDAGDDEEAGVLWGAVEAEERRTLFGAWQRDRGRFVERLGELPPDALRRGRALTLDEAVAYALSVD